MHEHEIGVGERGERDSQEIEAAWKKEKIEDKLDNTK